MEQTQDSSCFPGDKQARLYCTHGRGSWHSQVRGLFPPRAPLFARRLLLTAVLLVSSVAAVILPVAVQGLGQADGEVAAGKLPQGTRVPVLPGVDQRRLCRRKRRCSARGQHLPHPSQMLRLRGAELLGPHPALCPAPVTFGAERGRGLKGARAAAEDQHRHSGALRDRAPAGASPGEKKDPNPC